MLSTLAHTPADVVRYVLVDLGLGDLPQQLTAWSIYAERMGDYDYSICVTTTEGILNGFNQVQGEAFEHHGIQIRCRSVNPAFTYRKMSQVQEAIDKLISSYLITIPDTETGVDCNYIVDAVTRTGTIISMGMEIPQSGRFSYTLNATVTLRQLS